MTDLAARLDRLRGDAPARNHDARTIAALTTNPGCGRRGLMDAAGIDKDAVARYLGFPAPFGQSQFAIARGNAFEKQVKDDGFAELFTLLRERLGLPVPQVAIESLDEVGGNHGSELRHAQTRRALARALAGDGSTLFDHPLLRLDIAGQPAYLEPDVLAFRLGDKFYVIEIKSFAIIDGQADPEQVAAAARQSAVYVLALRRLLTELGHPATAVSHEVILVCPENFSNQPAAAFVDVRKQLSVIERQLSRMSRIDDLVAALPEEMTFELGDGLASAIRVVEARYAPDCVSSCELAFFCRDEARACGSTDLLGIAVRDDVGGVETLATALGLADGSLVPAPEQVEIAAKLRLARLLRAQALEGVA
jgi:hypothetical protein